jgi:hypothetical protein
MKTLSIVIRAELEIPDDWEVVEHPSGIQVLKIGADFVDFDIAPLVTQSEDPEAEWSDADGERVGAVLDTVVGVEVDLELPRHH